MLAYVKVNSPKKRNCRMNLGLNIINRKTKISFKDIPELAIPEYPEMTFYDHHMVKLRTTVREIKGSIDLVVKENK